MIQTEPSLSLSLSLSLCRFRKVKSHISEKYADVEGTLVDEFIESHCALDTRRMKMYAKALQPFPYVSQQRVHKYSLC